MPLVTPVTFEQDTRELTAVFQLLSDPTRLNIMLQLLNFDERNVSNLCRDLKLPQPTISHHLGLLRSKQLVGYRRQGKQIFYNLHPCRAQENGQKQLSIQLSGCAVQVSFLDAPPPSLENPA